jgi:putative restriction endonuclease
MRGFVANCDYEQFAFLRGIEPAVDEVNFWRPGSETSFKALRPGEPFFFKVKAPRNAIGGFGYFAHFSFLPVSMAWAIYGQTNGAASYSAMRERLLRIRSRLDMTTDRRQDFWIGCILINQPLFFDEDDCVPVPTDFSTSIVQGKRYELTAGEGQRIWLECLAKAAEARDGIEALMTGRLPSQTDLLADEQSGATSASPMTIRQRLGPRSFRVAVLDAYGRRCAVTSERTLPALEAAHIRDYGTAPEHSINNGILFRADLHRLFDAGYVTVTPNHRLEVSRRIKEEFEDGREYYKLHGATVRLPKNPADHPLVDALWWHGEERFLG